MSSIYNFLNSTLINNATLAGLVGTDSNGFVKIYPSAAPQGTSFPFVTYNVISITPTNTKKEASTLDRIRVQVSVFDTDFGGAIAIKEQVRTLLQNILNTTTASTTVQVSTFQNEVDGISQMDGLDGVFYFYQDYFFFVNR